MLSKSGRKQWKTWKDRIINSKFIAEQIYYANLEGKHLAQQLNIGDDLVDLFAEKIKDRTIYFEMTEGYSDQVLEVFIGSFIHWSKKR